VTDFQNERARVAELETLLRQGKVDESVALGTELIEEYPDSFLIRLHLARALKENNALLRAETVLSVLDTRYGDNITFLMERGDLLRRLGRLDDARLDYQKILFLDPFNNKVKTILEEIEAEKLTQENAAFEVVDYRSPAFRDDQTVPEIVMKTEEKEELVSYEPVIDLDSDPENETFFNPVGPETDEEEPKAFVAESDEQRRIEIVSETDPEEEVTGQSKEEEGWIQVELSSPTETEAGQEVPSGNHEMGFVTESAARLYAQQGLYTEALSIYERLSQMTGDDKFLGQINGIKQRIASERQLDYFKKLLSHFTSERGSYFV